MNRLARCWMVVLMVHGSACTDVSLHHCPSGLVCGAGFMCAPGQDVCVPEYGCGNGIIEEHAGESCDDGNLISGDGCPDDCSSCGNGERDPGEVCDGQPPAGETCSSYGYDMGTLGCSSRCDGVSVRGCKAIGWKRWETLPENWHFGRMWGFGRDQVYAVGYVGDAARAFELDSKGTVFFYDGETWTATELDAPVLTSIWGASPESVYAVGRQGTILHYDGQAWSPMVSGTTLELVSVWGTRADDVYAMGTSITGTDADRSPHHQGGFILQSAEDSASSGSCA